MNAQNRANKGTNRRSWEPEAHGGREGTLNTLNQNPLSVDSSEKKKNEERKRGRGKHSNRAATRC